MMHPGNMNDDRAKAGHVGHSVSPHASDALDQETLIDVLVVDDDEVFLEEIVGYLRTQGLKAVGTASVQEAIAIMVIRKPKLTLMDIMLPQLTGIRALEIVLALDYRQDVVLMTGGHDVYVEARQSGVGALDIIKKPLSSKSLNTILKASSEFSERRTTIGL